MTTDTDLLLAFCKEQWEQARQTEKQRAAATNLIIVVISILLGIISSIGLNYRVLPLTCLLVALGLLGALISAKYSERFHFHHAKVWHWQQKLAQLHPEANLLDLEEEAVEKHTKKYPLIFRLRLHWLWIVLNLGIALAGIILTVLIVDKGVS